MERGYDAGSADARESAALMATIDAELLRHGINPQGIPPMYGAHAHNTRILQCATIVNIAPQQFTNNASMMQNVMAGGGVMTRFLSSMPMPPPPPVPNYQLVHWLMMQRAIRDQELVQASQDNGVTFGGRHSPITRMQITNPPHHVGIFQRSVMDGDLHSQAEAVAQVMMSAYTARHQGGGAESMADHFGHGGYHPPELDEEESVNSPTPPPRPNFAEPQPGATSNLSYQDSLINDDDQHYSNVDYLLQEYNKKHVTFEEDSTNTKQPPGNTCSTVTSSVQHNIFRPYATDFADPSHKDAAAPAFSSLPTYAEEMYPQKEVSAHQPGPVINNHLNSRIHEVAGYKTNMGAEPEFINEQNHSATENAVRCTEINRHMHGMFRSAARGRKNATPRKIKKTSHSKEVRSVAEQAGQKETCQAAHNKKYPLAAKETRAKEIAKTDTSKKPHASAKRASSKEATRTYYAQVTPTAAKKTQKVAGDQPPVVGSTNTEQAAQSEGSRSDGVQASTRTRNSLQKKRKAKAGKKFH